MKCTECKAEMKALEARPYPYEESGLDNVVLFGVTEYRCPQCGNEMARIPHPLQLHILLAVAISLKEGHLTGAEIRFLRREVGMNGKAFAEAVGVTPVSLSRWENDKEKQSESHDRLMRYVFRFVMQERLQTTINFLEDALKQAQVVSFENKKVHVHADQMRFITLPHAAVCECQDSN